MSQFSVVNEVIKFIYPPRCVLCGRAIPDLPQVFFCGKCAKISGGTPPPYCAKCGRGTGDLPGEICRECAEVIPAYDRGGALWPYTGKYKRAVLDLKFNTETEKGETLGIICAADIKKKQLADDIDIIIPVPLHWLKLYTRGYNQAELIAKSVGKRLEIPVDTACLKRAKRTVPQMRLDLEQRRVNMRGAMKIVEPEKVAGKNILLIDDIYTTGSTINECALQLKKNGAKTVNCYCVCISL